jgi:hypothetical protein
LHEPLSRGADAQLPVPLHESVVHVAGSLAHTMPVPTQLPDPLHVSLYVHTAPSLHVPDVRGVEVHVFVPLQDSVVHVAGSLAQEIVVPTQVPPPLHVSL